MSETPAALFRVSEVNADAPVSLVPILSSAYSRDDECNAMPSSQPEKVKETARSYPPPRSRGRAVLAFLHSRAALVREPLIPEDSCARLSCCRRFTKIFSSAHARSFVGLSSTAGNGSTADVLDALIDLRTRRRRRERNFRKLPLSRHRSRDGKRVR